MGIASLIFPIVILNNRPVINNDSSFISSSDITSSLSMESSEDDSIYQNNDSYLLIYDIRYEDDFIDNQSSFSININSKDIYYSYISFLASNI